MATDLKFNIKLSEPSEISFVLPKFSDGKPTPYYDEVSGYKLIYTKHYGVYVVMNPSTEADGIAERKTVKGYSMEKTLDAKRFFLEEGTYNFWNPAVPEDTILGRALEAAPGWGAGYISPSLTGLYRTFDSYDDYLLSFLYNAVPEKYRCVFVFDPYAKTVSAYDADEERPTLPIYLDFDNLVQSLGAEEKTEELVTALRPYGADELDIRAVNPIGTGWLYDLSYFIANGDIPAALAVKWEGWQRSVLNHRAQFQSLTALRSSASARKLMEEAALTELKGELDDLVNQQSVTIQALAAESTQAGKDSQQEKLDEINAAIRDKKEEISSCEGRIKAVEEEMNGEGPNSYGSQIKAIVEKLAVERYFTAEEYQTLSKYFIEQDMTEETFVASELNAGVSGVTYSLTDGTVKAEGSAITELELDSASGKRMYTLAGGRLTVNAGLTITGDIVRGTLEVGADGAYVMSAYAGTIAAGDKKAESGMVTMTGTLSGLTGDIHSVTEDGITSLKGTTIQFSTGAMTLYLTANVSEYQRYSVQMELYDYAAGVLSERATPTYEFTVDAANFLFAREFKPFRDKLELGKGVHLRVGGDMVITPLLIELSINFERQDDFSLIFSNRFKRHDSVNTLKDMIEKGYSSGRSFDAGKHLYNQAAGQAAKASKFMESSLDAARNAIVAAKNESVVINGSGIHVGGDGRHKLRIIDRMIAMTDDDWQSAKLAVGLFSTPDVGTYWGVNGEVIGGKLLVGNNLIVENKSDTGIMQFKVDASGAWLNNSTFVLQKDGGGKLVLSPQYGMAAGPGTLYTTEGTTVRPSFIDENGNIIKDKDGLPKNANFYLDPRDGSAYFRGTVHATDGVFNGTVYATDGKFTGEIEATKGTFSGTIKAATLDGKLVGGTNGGVLEGIGLNVGDGKFVVDRSGNLTLAGNINLSGGNITWGNNIPNKKRYAASTSGPWHDTMQSGDIYCCDWNYAAGTWGNPYKFVGKDGTDGADGKDALGTWENVKKALSSAAAIKESIITIDGVGSPNIYGGKIYGTEIYSGDGQDSFVRMTKSGLEVFVDDISKPKFTLGLGESADKSPFMVLGSGDGAGSNRFWIGKGERYAMMQYRYSNRTTGFMFNDDGTITVSGELKGVTAEFG